MAIPSFNQYGVLPDDVDATLDEIENSFLVTGAGLDLPDWAAQSRKSLVDNLRTVVTIFRDVGGVKDIFVNGSFVTERESPSDIDGYFTLVDVTEWRSGEFQRRLNERDPSVTPIWTWRKEDRVSCFTPSKRPPYWCRYFVDLQPDLGLRSDILGPDGTFLTIPDAFRQVTETRTRKGIIRLVD
jgi:hypothetical protein